MYKERSKAIVRGQQLDRFYSGLSREKLIDELTATERSISSSETSEELKSLYRRRYLKILDILKEKLEISERATLNKKVS